jgi:putative hydrolase of the HAD superfamily
MSKIKLAIFDFFGVISSGVSVIWLKQFFTDEQINDIDKKYMEKADANEISHKTFFSEMGKLTNLSATQVEKQWLDFVRINNELIEFIKQLKKSVKVMLLSNADSVFLRKVLKSNDLEVLFDHIIISSEVYMIKPNKEIFDLALKMGNAKPQETLFVDDTYRNIVSANSLGINAIWFKDNKTCFEQINELIKK